MAEKFQGRLPGASARATAEDEQTDQRTGDPTLEAAGPQPTMTVDLSAPNVTFSGRGVTPGVSAQGSFGAEFPVAFGGGPTPSFHPDWVLGRNEIVTKVQEARAHCHAIERLIAQAEAVPPAQGDNQGPLRVEALASARLVTRTAMATLDVLAQQLTLSSPEPTVVNQNEQSLKLTGWACKQLAGGALGWVGYEATRYSWDHHHEIVQHLHHLSEQICQLAHLVHGLFL